MWTKQSGILKYCEQYLESGSVDEILQTLPKLKITIRKEEVLDEIKRLQQVEDETNANNYLSQSRDKTKYAFDEEEYAYNLKALSIYKNKCLMMSTILLTLAKDFALANKIINGLDLTVEQDKIATTDLIRILKPLKTN